MSHLYDTTGGEPSWPSSWSSDVSMTDRAYVGHRQAMDLTGNRRGVRYPSPFFDVASMYMPKSYKQLLQWCSYYFMTNPLINAVISKMSEYPVTDLIIEDPDQRQKELWEHVAENVLQIRKTRIELNLDYYTFGEAYLTVNIPFTKWLRCRNCGNKPGGYFRPVEDSRHYYRWRNTQFHLQCPVCGSNREANVEDHQIKDLKQTRLVRWNPMYIDVEYNHITGNAKYYHTPPPTTWRDIQMGKRSVIEETPEEFIDAVRKGKSVLFKPGKIYHLKRASIAQTHQGRGMPLILPVLKDVFYLQILRKAQESVANDHIVPLHLLFPQGGDELSSPYATTNLGAWRERIEIELVKHRMDPGYIPVLPLPVGHQMLGGQGRALILHQEIRVWAEHIVAGMGTPQEFIFGGLQWSGSSVSLRMMENTFLGLNSEHINMVRDFIIGSIADHMGYQRPKKVSFGKFKMADDLQRFMVYFQLNQAQKVSDATMLRELGEDLSHEEDLKKAEVKKQIENFKRTQLAQAEVMGQQQYIAARWQQKAMMGDALSGTASGAPAPKPPPGAGSSSPPAGAPAGAGAQKGQGIPGMPAGATLDPQNAKKAPQLGAPDAAQSPLSRGQMVQAGGGGVNLLYAAKRAAAYIRSLPEGQKQQELQKMNATPQLKQHVLEILRQREGGNEKPLDPFQRPLPTQKPPRRGPGSALV